VLTVVTREVESAVVDAERVIAHEARRDLTRVDVLEATRRGGERHRTGFDRARSRDRRDERGRETECSSHGFLPPVTPGNGAGTCIDSRIRSTRFLPIFRFEPRCFE